MTPTDLRQNLHRVAKLGLGYFLRLRTASVRRRARRKQVQIQSEPLESSEHILVLTNLEAEL
jgi:hypothetical protein